MVNVSVFGLDCLYFLVLWVVSTRYIALKDIDFLAMYIV